jgi:hypothetical protein
MSLETAERLVAIENIHRVEFTPSSGWTCSTGAAATTTGSWSAT